MAINAAEWRAHMTERQPAAGAAAAPAAAAGAAAAPAAVAAASGASATAPLPTHLSFEDARPYCVQEVGCLLWHEARTHRARATYTVAGVETSHSCLISNYATVTDAIKYCLRWQWGKHREAKGVACPWSFRTEL